ncbi:MAG: sce7726 family protein [Solirubrobacteraceae bacterium]
MSVRELESPPWMCGTPLASTASPRVLEAVVREALRAHAMAAISGARDAVDEFWVPRSNERADIAVIGRSMDGFEIKTERDTLKRLPRQAEAYGRLFDRCTAVVAQKHSDQAAQILPGWWGITTVVVDGSVRFTVLRPSRPNAAIDPETLVRLLWRDEAMAALVQLGREPEQRASRGSLWNDLLQSTTVGQLRDLVRRALLCRDPAQARIATRRFTTQLGAAGAGS